MKPLLTRSLFSAAIILLIAGGGLLFLSGSPSVTVAQQRQSESSGGMSYDDAAGSIRDAFGSSSNRPSNMTGFTVSNILFMVIAGCVIVGLFVLLLFVERFYHTSQTKNGYYSLRQLFRELCKAHNFTSFQQTILQNIARELQLKNPAVLFIEPKYLDLAITESVGRYPPETVRQIFNALFGSGTRTTGSGNEEDNTWFAWTKVMDNPDADQLKKEDAELPQTQLWDASVWEDVQQNVKGTSQEKADAYSQVPIYQSPPLREEVQKRERTAYHNTDPSLTPFGTTLAPPESDRTVQEKPVYKPRYPETQDALVHESPGGNNPSTIGDQKTPPPPTPQHQTPPSAGAQILSSMLYSVSDVTNELAYSSIRNHLTRSLSLSPQTFGEMKQKTSGETPSGSAIPLDEIMVSPQRQSRLCETQTQVETKADPKVAIKQVELGQIGTTGSGPLW